MLTYSHRYENTRNKRESFSAQYCDVLISECLFNAINKAYSIAE